MKIGHLVQIAADLEEAGLIWQPEIGDEVSEKSQPVRVSILVDPQGMTPSELRTTFLWLPTVEQLINQLEARQAILFHAGLELSEKEYCYRTVIRASVGEFEASAQTLRCALALSMRDFLLAKNYAVN
ncbi:MAG: hypothetical protein GX589_06895 [Deltaproteobacteria bacterium]|nr:hypothetical protein [Deltaproteobacteria bacterium]